MKERNDLMDNFGVHVTARDMETFRSAFRLAFNPPGKMASHFVIKPIEQINYMVKAPVDALILCWSKTEGVLELPYKMDVDSAMGFAEGWLRTAKFPAEPNHDGSNAPGFQITTGDFWGHIGTPCSILAVLPCWGLLGK